MIFNVNHKVRVRLTDRGRDILRDRCRRWHASYHQSVPAGLCYVCRPREDEGGWSEWQLWQLMEIFGRHLYIGLSGPDLPFHPDIDIITPPEASPPVIQDPEGRTWRGREPLL